MIYRVILKVGYYENWFDFDTIAEAGGFAKSVLVHSVPNEDRKTQPAFVTIEVVNPERMKVEKEDE